MCRAESPHLSALQKKFKKSGLVVLGINIDNDTAAKIEKFQKSKGLEYTMLLHGDGIAMREYFCRAFPTVYWIDKRGNIAARDYGYQTPDRLEERARSLLAR